MQSWIEELVGHYGDLRRYLVRELRDPHHAADIAQSSFERVYVRAMEVGPARGARETPDGITSMRALLFRVARNLCIDDARHRQVVQAWMVDRGATQPTAAPSTEYLASQQQVLERVAALLTSLPPRRREVFLLSRAYGYSHAEIAEHLCITEMAVAKHLVRAAVDCSRALAALRTDLLDPDLPSPRQPFAATLAEDAR
ncbi:RNA polymerase sigma factor [Roseateles sp.]|uniref:RNA polymerase sigma factor n=1 Tax=Roseateles sp. TaxID=1971397 RepID=UPI0039EBE517